jgi:hypothetical protein
MWLTRWIGVAGLLGMLGGSAHAAPGELMAHAAGEIEPLQILDPPPIGRSCGKPGLMCWFAGARTTIAVESAAVASASASGKDVAVPVAPRFARASQPKTDGVWTLDLQATLKRPSWAGNLVFLLYDAEDSEALEARQFTALYQASVKTSKLLSARLSLSNEEGFRAGHTYRVRIVQLINGREILLAEGDVTLL